MTQSPELRGLSLWQLSASAIAFGAKRIETRTWAVSQKRIGQRIAIHAGKTLGPGRLTALQSWMAEPQEQEWLQYAGYSQAEELPRGFIVATAVISRCMPTDELRSSVSDLEWSHGDYSPGRYGWELAEIRRLFEPVSFPGSLGLFKIPANVAQQVSDQEIVDDDREWTTEVPDVIKFARQLDQPYRSFSRR